MSLQWSSLMNNSSLPKPFNNSYIQDLPNISHLPDIPDISLSRSLDIERYPLPQSTFSFEKPYIESQSPLTPFLSTPPGSPSLSNTSTPLYTPPGSPRVDTIKNETRQLPIDIQEYLNSLPSSKSSNLPIPSTHSKKTKILQQSKSLIPVKSKTTQYPTNQESNSTFFGWELFLLLFILIFIIMSFQA